MSRPLIVVPARHGSTRFPAKPLHPIAGRTLLQRVAKTAERAATAAGADYVVATDHEAIAAHCRDIGAPVVMTPSEAPSGTDRALLAVVALRASPDVVVNLQGDSPFTPPAHVVALIEAARTGGCDAATPVVRLSWDQLDALRAHKAVEPFSGTTCVVDGEGRAVWFSKTILPAIRKEAALRKAGDRSPVLRHVGLYAYRLAALERYVTLPEGRYERHEGLEQLRLLENGLTICAVEVDAADHWLGGVDTPEDARVAEALIARFGDPYDAG